MNKAALPSTSKSEYIHPAIRQIECRYESEIMSISGELRTKPWENEEFDVEL